MDRDVLIAEIRRLYDELRGDMRAKWSRDLPLEELLFDRWERAASLGFGEGSSIYHNSYVYGSVTVGRHSWIGPFTLLDGSGGLSIGDFCSVSAGVQIYTHNTVAWAVSGGRAAAQRAPVRIEDRCYIGSHAVVAQGVTIGAGAVIGACAFVNRDVPAAAIAVGTPARVIGHTECDDSGTVALCYD